MTGACEQSMHSSMQIRAEAAERQALEPSTVASSLYQQLLWHELQNKAATAVTAGCGCPAATSHAWCCSMLSHEAHTLSVPSSVFISTKPKPRDSPL